MDDIKNKHEYKSRKCQLVQNDRRAVQSMAQLIKANFEKDNVILRLEYSEEWYRKAERDFEIVGIEGENKAEELRQRAEHQLKLCIRRVRRACEKNGIKPKYIFVTSDVDKENRERLCVVHNVIISKELKDLFIIKWDKGPVEEYTITDYSMLAKDLIFTNRREWNKKKYSPSRNLAKEKM